MLLAKSDNFFAPLDYDRTPISTGEMSTGSRQTEDADENNSQCVFRNHPNPDRNLVHDYPNSCSSPAPNPAPDPSNHRRVRHPYPKLKRHRRKNYGHYAG